MVNDGPWIADLLTSSWKDPLIATSESLGNPRLVELRTMKLRMTVVQRSPRLWSASNDHSRVLIERQKHGRNPDVYTVRGERFPTLKEAVARAAQLLALSEGAQ